jgi:hypothetical protein
VDSADVAECVVSLLHSSGDAVFEREDSAVDVSGGDGVGDLAIVAEWDDVGIFAKVPNERLVAEGTDLALEGDAGSRFGVRHWHRTVEWRGNKKGPRASSGAGAVSAWCGATVLLVFARVRLVPR